MSNPLEDFHEIIVGPDRYLVDKFEVVRSQMPDGCNSLIVSVHGFQADTGESKVLHFMSTTADWINFFRMALDHYHGDLNE